MATVSCLRCGNTAESLAKQPLPGELGDRIQASTCAACWSAWLDAQVMLINENRLTGANPQHVEYLMNQMQTFLNLQDTPS